ncbi:MAG: hypothetical protein IIT39_01330, partial [Clostridia bacterium]|nr:hypothetical protein [Clostridia bacterium]
MNEIPQMNEIKNFADGWGVLLKLSKVVGELEIQNENLVAINREQFAEIKRLLLEIDRLRKIIEKQEQKIKDLSDSERILKLAQDKVYQANRISDEAKIQMKQAEHLKSTLEDLIN